MSVSPKDASPVGANPLIKPLEAALRRHRYQPDALLEILHVAQASLGYLSGDVLRYVAHALKLPLSRVYGVASFYHLFTLRPRGRHTCTICLGTTCHVERAGAILEAVEQSHGVGAGGTTQGGGLSVEVARCVGTCSMAPVVLFDAALAGGQTPEGVLARLKDWTDP
jgi:bidirectional [NiFe] hydrogenase diaphorase subunit